MSDRSDSSTPQIAAASLPEEFKTTGADLIVESAADKASPVTTAKAEAIVQSSGATLAKGLLTTGWSFLCDGTWSMVQLIAFRAGHRSGQPSLPLPAGALTTLLPAAQDFVDVFPYLRAEYPGFAKRFDLDQHMEILGRLNPIGRLHRYFLTGAAYMEDLQANLTTVLSSNVRALFDFTQNVKNEYLQLHTDHIDMHIRRSAEEGQKTKAYGAKVAAQTEQETLGRVRDLLKQMISEEESAKSPLSVFDKIAGAVGQMPTKGKPAKGG